MPTRAQRSRLDRSTRALCAWVYLHAQLGARAGSTTYDNRPSTWRDHCSDRERAVLEDAILAGVWSPPEGD